MTKKKKKKNKHIIVTGNWQKIRRQLENILDSVLPWHEMIHAAGSHKTWRMTHWPMPVGKALHIEVVSNCRPAVLHSELQITWQESPSFVNFMYSNDVNTIIFCSQLLHYVNQLLLVSALCSHYNFNMVPDLSSWSMYYLLLTVNICYSFFHMTIGYEQQ